MAYNKTVWSGGDIITATKLNKIENELENSNERGLPSGGTAGQILRKTSTTDYDAAWADVGTPTDAQVDDAVADWLTTHPEATTTVPLAS